MPGPLLRFDNDLIVAENPGFHETFNTNYTLASTTLLNFTKSNSGTAAFAENAAGGGKLTITTDTSANDYANVTTSQKMFIFAVNQPFRVHAQFSSAEANTNTSGLCFGVASNTITTLLADTTTLPGTNQTCAMFWKQTGTLYWQTITSVGTTQVITNLNTVKNFPGYSASGSAPPVVTKDSNLHNFDVEFYPISSTVGEVSYFIDGAFVHKDTFTITSAAAMYAVLGVKGVTGTNAESMVANQFWGRIRRLPVTPLTI